MKAKEMDLSAVLTEMVNVLRPEMKKAALEGLQHYMIQTEVWETAKSEEEYYRLLEMAEYQMPTLLQNSWKHWLGGFVDGMKMGQEEGTLEELKAWMLSLQAILDEKAAKGIDLNEPAE
jgi:hypothetical protein